MKNRIIIIFLLINFICIESLAQLSKDSIQALFPCGNFVSFNDNVACYRLKGIKKGGMYGFCYYNQDYKPELSFPMHSWSSQGGEVTKWLNSPCYTIIAPMYDYALPFSQGWAPVCIGKKWTYVSKDGHYLFDFVLDAAFPFEQSKARVLFEGQYYEIDLNGQGLPDNAYKKTSDLELTLKANIINQLFLESQYEKAVYNGKKIYEDITTAQNGLLPELSAKGLADAIKIASFTMAAQNNIMSLSVNRLRDIFNEYRTLHVNRFVSFESRHPSLLRYNAERYFSVYKSIYSKENSAIIVEIDRCDYKAAIIKFEDWIEKNNVSIKDNFLLLMTYYYLSELSDDFENANRLLIHIADMYENKFKDLDIEEDALGVLLSDIKKYQSAELVFSKFIRQNRGKKNKEVLFSLYYNMALMYKSAKEQQQSIDCFHKALKIELPEEMTAIRLECLADFLHSQLAVGEVEEDLLDEYVNSEIDYNANLFESKNTLVTNRYWGNSLQRMQRLLCYLGVCTDEKFLKSAFALSVFQQGIIFDVEKYMTKSVSFLNSPVLTKQYQDFLNKKMSYKGIDVFDFISTDLENRDSIYQLFYVEEKIKNTIKQRLGHYIPTAHYKAINNEKLLKNMIDVVVYNDSCNLFRIGAFVYSSNDEITFIPLSVEDEFSSDKFWDAINVSKRFNKDADIYVYYSVLDTFGLEYYKTKTGVVPYTKYRLHRSSSLANTIEDKNVTAKDAVLYGGLDYGDKLVAESRGASRGYLEYSEIEINSICRVLQHAGMKIQLKTEDNGTIDSFRKLSGNSPNILHFATHGYSIKKSHEYNLMEDRFNYYRQNTDIQQREWLMNNTGLFVSLDSLGNNVLNANVVASCDFSHTNLVVLSACSTMSGRNSDGNMQTIGLTTAFSLASAHNIITSLRDVNDKKACEFMVIFYENYTKTGLLYDSFRNTVFTMQQRYIDYPYFWNSFVLVEN